LIEKPRQYSILKGGYKLGEPGSTGISGKISDFPLDPHGGGIIKSPVIQDV
jgi:hypothetical protein